MVKGTRDSKASCECSRMSRVVGEAVDIVGENSRSRQSREGQREVRA